MLRGGIRPQAQALVIGQTKGLRDATPRNVWRARWDESGHWIEAVPIV
jgi:hypothetical protein